MKKYLISLLTFAFITTSCSLEEKKHTSNSDGASFDASLNGSDRIRTKNVAVLDTDDEPDNTNYIVGNGRKTLLKTRSI